MTVEFGPDQIETLERLTKSLGTTKASVLRYGLALLTVAVRESRRGKSLGIVDGSKVESRLVGIWDESQPIGA